jgi:hypothetical protein
MKQASVSSTDQGGGEAAAFLRLCEGIAAPLWRAAQAQTAAVLGAPQT